MGRLPLRLRLTLVFAGASALLLAAVGGFIFLQVKAGLDASLDSSLSRTVTQFAKLAQRGDRAQLRRSFAASGEAAQLLDGEGKVLLASPRGRSIGSLLRPGELQMASRSEGHYERQESVRLISRPVPGDRVVVTSTSMVQRERALEELSRVLLIGGGLVLLLSSGAGYLVAAGALRPVDRMRRRAAEISAATPDARLPVPRAQDELGRLGSTLNAMLSRLEASAEHERAFLATASHELRTPLAILKAEVDLALDEGSDDSELRAALASIGEETNRLIRLAEDLLIVARGEAGNLPLHACPVPLDELACTISDRFAAITGGAVRSRVPDGLVARADPLRLEQAVANLVENALRHGATPVDLTATHKGGFIELHVRDSGAGFDREHLEHAFTPVGGGRASGFGLGLLIVATIARAHGGSVGAANTGFGADVWLSVPLATRSSDAS